MATIMPQSELARKAVTWIAEARAETGKPMRQLIEEACIRFNLGPNDAQFLERSLIDSEKPRDAPTD